MRGIADAVQHPLRNDDNTILIADHNVTGFDGDTSGNDREADPSGSGLDARVWRDAPRENRQSNLNDALGVPRHAIDHDRLHAGILCHLGDDVADNRGRGESIGRGHYDVALLSQCNRRQNGEVIGRPRFAGQRCADEL